MRFVRNHREMLPHAEPLADGLGMGTGVLEGAIKHAVAASLDGSGRQSSPRRDESVLAPRLALVDDPWARFESHKVERHEECEATVVPRITPKGPRDSGPTCLDAACRRRSRRGSAVVAGRPDVDRDDHGDTSSPTTRSWPVCVERQPGRGFFCGVLELDRPDGTVGCP